MSSTTDRLPKASTRGALTRKPKSNFETWSWYAMRISGLILLFLALTHFAITHIINDVVETDAEFVANRWDNPLWRLFDWALLAQQLDSLAPEASFIPEIWQGHVNDGDGFWSARERLGQWF